MTTSAFFSSSTALSVSKSGWPGPAPTRYTLPQFIDGPSSGLPESGRLHAGEPTCVSRPLRRLQHMSLSLRVEQCEESEAMLSPLEVNSSGTSGARRGRKLRPRQPVSPASRPEKELTHRQESRLAGRY